MNDQVEVKVSRLKGLALDWAVAKALDVEEETLDPITWAETAYPSGCYNFSSNWSQGGPLIEQEGITLAYTHDVVRVAQAYHIEDLFDDEREEYCQKGETILVAAMRCIVARRLGLSVMVPAELL